MKNNAAVMTRLQQRFREDGAVYIFPEGRSHCDTHMRDFKTGAARLALDYSVAAQGDQTQKDLLIVPLGLHYQDKSAFRSTADIKIGKPISMQTWLQDYPVAKPHDLTRHLKQRVQHFAITHALQMLVLIAIGSVWIAVLYTLLFIPASVQALKAVDHFLNVKRRYPVTD